MTTTLTSADYPVRQITVVAELQRSKGRFIADEFHDCWDFAQMRPTLIIMRLVLCGDSEPDIWPRPRAASDHRLACHIGKHLGDILWTLCQKQPVQMRCVGNERP